MAYSSVWAELQCCDCAATSAVAGSLNEAAYPICKSRISSRGKVLIGVPRLSNQ